MSIFLYFVNYNKKKASKALHDPEEEVVGTIFFDKEGNQGKKDKHEHQQKFNTGIP